MKNIIIIVFLLCSINMLGQVDSDSVRISGCIQVLQADDANWMKRYQWDIDRYESENKQIDLACDVLFIGSSTLYRWETIHEDFAPLKVINRSYGGSTIRDIIYNYNTVARGYTPKKIVLYVENDLTGWEGHRAVSAGEAYDLFRIFAQMITRDYPRTKLYLISIKPSPSRVNNLEEHKILNHLLQDYASLHSNIKYIDVAAAMYNSEGELLTDIFVEDNLHLNKKGYKIWAQVLKLSLLEE